MHWDNEGADWLKEQKNDRKAILIGWFEVQESSVSRVKDFGLGKYQSYFHGFQWIWRLLMARYN
jgi:hypothetical protein